MPLCHRRPLPRVMAPLYMNVSTEPEFTLAWVSASDGARLRTGHWRPAGPPRGRVLLLQGLSEFLEKYAEVAAGLTGRGFEVYSFDWRGQGHSPLDGAKAPGVFARHLSDLDEMLLALPAGPLPLLLGHSMGAHLALRHLQRKPQAVAHAMLCSPMLGLRTGRWPRHLARRLAAGMIRLGLGGRSLPGRRQYTPGHIPFAMNPFTSDRASYRRLQDLLRADPDLGFGDVTWYWLAAAFDSLDRLHATGAAEVITTPVTFLLAGHDLIVDSHAAQAFAARLPHAKTVCIANARHELLQEAPAVLSQVWAAIDDAWSSVG